MTPIKSEGLDLISLTFEQNIVRAESFIEMYELKVDKNSKKRLVAETDLLRAAVMFIHSSLEEFFRSVEIEYWRDFDISYLNNIPFYWKDKMDGKLGLSN